MKGVVLKSWSECDGCGFKGHIDYHARDDENYDDRDALGYMMDASCPACGEEEPVLVLSEEYRDMILRATEEILGS